MVPNYCFRLDSRLVAISKPSWPHHFVIVTEDHVVKYPPQAHVRLLPAVKQTLDQSSPGLSQPPSRRSTSIPFISPTYVYAWYPRLVQLGVLAASACSIHRFGFVTALAASRRARNPEQDSSG